MFGFENTEGHGLQPVGFQMQHDDAPESGLTLDHVGLAVSSREEGLRLYRDGLGARVIGEETVEGQRVHVVKLSVGNTVVELIEPIEPGEGPVGKFLAKNGPGIHHVCFAVDDVTAAAKRLTEMGYQALSDGPVPGADGKLVLFLHPKTCLGTLIELSQDPSPPPTG